MSRSKASGVSGRRRARLGETLEAALVREVIEETGLEVVVVGPVVEVVDRRAARASKAASSITT